MLKRKPETLALSVALIGTLTVLLGFLGDLAFSRARDLENGEHRLQHFSIMMAEHTARAFEALDVLLREVAADLSANRRDWEQWDATRGWEYVAQRHSRAMPQLRDLIVFDRQGRQRFISTIYPAPEINVGDRPYFLSLAGGEETATYGPYVGRNSGRYTYAIAHRINDRNGGFAGAAFVAIEPAYLQDFCWSNRLSDNFETVLINTVGQIVASCRPTDISHQSAVIGKRAEDVLFDGRLRDQIPERGFAHRHDLLIAVTPVSAFPDLRILSVIPESTVLENWRSRLIELATLGGAVILVLLVGALLVRRQVRDMATITAELAASHDLLEQRVGDATRELAGQKDDAERANRAKSRFLAAASHDLRQPLHAMSLFAADLQRQIRAGNISEAPRLAGQLSASITQLSEMLDALLDVSRLDVSGVQAEIRPCALQPIFQRLQASSRRAAADRRVTLRFRPTDCWVRSDPLMLSRIIGNLVANAIRYTPPDGRILVAARRRGDQVLIEVRDNGIGIAPQHQKVIFTEFYQVGNSAREPGKGLGLGLSIVDRLARALGVPVELRSQLGAGSVFAVRVPHCRPDSEAEQLAELHAGRLHGIGTSEDLDECLRLGESWGYAVSRDGGEGRLNPPPDGALIIADGELAARISSELKPGGPWIVLPDGAEAPLPAGAQALNRPLRPARLRALIGQLQKTLPRSMP